MGAGLASVASGESSAAEQLAGVVGPWGVCSGGSRPCAGDSCGGSFSRPGEQPGVCDTGACNGQPWPAGQHAGAKPDGLSCCSSAPALGLQGGLIQGSSSLSSLGHAQAAVRAARDAAVAAVLSESAESVPSTTRCAGFPGDSTARGESRAAASSAIEDDGGAELHVVIDKARPEQDLGIRVLHKGIGVLVVAEITAGGAVHAANRLNAVRGAPCLEVGDQIALVNGVAEEDAAMANECKRSARLHLGVRRPSRAANAAATNAAAASCTGGGGGRGGDAAQGYPAGLCAAPRSPAASASRAAASAAAAAAAAASERAADIAIGSSRDGGRDVAGGEGI